MCIYILTREVTTVSIKNVTAQCCMTLPLCMTVLFPARLKQTNEAIWWSIKPQFCSKTWNNS